MSCTVSEELSAYLDGELPPLQLKQLHSHLATCSECRSIEQLLRRTLLQLSQLAIFEPSAASRRAVLSRVERESHSFPSELRSMLRPQLLFPSLGFIAAAIVAVVISKEPGLDVREPALFDVAANLEVAEDYEVLGVNGVEDLEVVQHLHELEAKP